MRQFTVHTTTNYSGVSSSRSIFGGKRQGILVRTFVRSGPVPFIYLQHILKEKMYINNTSTGDDLKKKNQALASSI